MTQVRRFGCAMILLLACTTGAFAQGTGDIVGRVTDASGGVLPGVTVTATNLGTNIPRTTVTTETGDYAFTLLPVANYEIKTELAGFSTKTARVGLATGDRARVDVKLELGTVSGTGCAHRAAVRGARHRPRPDGCRRYGRKPATVRQHH